ncbi:hypothetical protein PENFLA_c002G09464 [Penicillium flavigenum]|uniref:Aromatic amino acid beta-eliminating lyase/threonine aldolase domain-containing protein n=1 Tax=Penicillium flavigenum TaxID=254877 RepID=A0A1V6TZS3_9EURO|nr:hypothetical protein PENFLA_c002G09464 [Penicillium flavigenum]
MSDLPMPQVWRTKMVEHIHYSTKEQREKWIQAADYNLFNLRSDPVFIDLLTDSGTGAMSDQQWAAMMAGDESYAGSSSFHKLQRTVADIFGLQFLLPVHQGRAAENALFSILVKPGDIIPANSHFDTTRAHIEYRKATAIDCPADVAFNTLVDEPFKGNINLSVLRKILEDHEKVPFILLTLTCNVTGGQPISMENITAVKQIATDYGKPLVIDSARFAENAWFIQQREHGFRQNSIREITRQIFLMADAMLMSAKKDGLVNIGGFMATCRQDWFDAATGQILINAGIPIQRPVGGHAVLVNAGSFLPAVPQEEYVAQTLAVALYVEAGVRGVEIGTLLNGRDPSTGCERFAEVEFLRLAIPRRVYSNEQMQYVARALINIYRRRSSVVRGLSIVEEKPILRHFTFYCAFKSQRAEVS